MLRISATGEYALLLVRSLLDHPERRRIVDVARDIDAPEPLLRKIVNSLERGGIVKTSRGRGGGVCLANASPSIYDVLRAAGEDLRVTVCSKDGGACDRSGDCAIAPTVARLQRGIEAVLRVSRV